MQTTSRVVTELKQSVSKVSSTQECKIILSADFFKMIIDDTISSELLKWLKSQNISAINDRNNLFQYLMALPDDFFIKMESWKTAFDTFEEIYKNDDQCDDNFIPRLTADPLYSLAIPVSKSMLEKIRDKKNEVMQAARNTVRELVPLKKSTEVELKEESTRLSF